MTVKIVTYRALEDGPALTVLGAVHGNERCGAEAIRRFIDEIDSGAVGLKRGTLRLVPVTNPRAYAAGVRYMERNLNRHLYPKDEKVHYEDHLDPILCGVLDETEVLLDLHSYTSPGRAFIFLGGKDPKETAYARALGVKDFVYGWSEAFGQDRDRMESQGTTEYARTKNALAVTLECGNHFNPDAPEVGYNAILLALGHLGMLEGKAPPADEAGQRCVKMKSAFHRVAGATLARPWKHFDAVARGETLATLAGGGVIAAPEDGFVIMPNDKAPVDDEWFFFGTETGFPA